MERTCGKLRSSGPGRLLIKVWELLGGGEVRSAVP